MKIFLLKALLIINGLAIFSSCAPDESKEVAFEAEVPLLPEEVPKRYDIPENAFTIYDGEIGKNQFLADILLKYGVPYGDIASLEHVAKDVHAVTKLRAGDKYAMFCAKDSAKTACYFVVETSNENYVVYQLNDSIAAYIGQKPVEIKIREAGAIINSSLYKSIDDNDLHLSLAHKLAEIFAWTVDFYRIQKGDYFKVIFEEKYVDGQNVGVGKILACEFNHRGTSFTGYAFQQNGILNYFDADGESLRKAFLKAPLEFSRISSRYSLKRYHPVQKRWKAHLGTDYAAPNGTPIMTTGDGTVINSEHGRYNGNYVKIRHNSTYTSQYLHMSKRAVKKGDVVRQGQVIGYVGSTGLATGPHVCYRFWKDGKQVDPYQQDLPPSDPVDEKLKDRFILGTDSLKPRLQGITLPDENV